MEMRAHYDAVIRDLETRCSDMQQQISELSRNIKRLHITLDSIRQAAGIPPPAASNGRVPRGHDTYRFYNWSNRWALLCVLDEQGPSSTQELAATLQAGGKQTDATNPINNVSAVLSQMRLSKEEVDLVDGKWVITPTGRSAWNHIRTKKLKLSSVRAEAPDAGTSGGPTMKGDSL